MSRLTDYCWQWQALSAGTAATGVYEHSKPPTPPCTTAPLATICTLSLEQQSNCLLRSSRLHPLRLHHHHLMLHPPHIDTVPTPRWLGARAFKRERKVERGAKQKKKKTPRRQYPSPYLSLPRYLT